MCVCVCVCVCVWVKTLASTYIISNAELLTLTADPPPPCRDHATWQNVNSENTSHVLWNNKTATKTLSLLRDVSGEDCSYCMTDGDVRGLQDWYWAAWGFRRILLWRGLTYRYNNLINKVLFWRRPHFVFASSPNRFFDSLQAGRPGDRIPVWARFSAPVQTGPGAHPATCTMGTGSFPEVKRPGSGFDHPPPSVPKLKKE